MSGEELRNSVGEAAKNIGALLQQGEATEKKQEEPQTPEEPDDEIIANDEDTEDTSEDAEELDELEDEESENGSETFTFKANGELQEVSMDKLKELAAAGFNYTQKMQDLNERIQTEAEKLAKEKTADVDKYRQSLIEATELVESLYSRPLVTSEKLEELLKDGDTEEYLRLKNQEESRQKLLTEVKKEREKINTHRQQEYQEELKKEASKQTAILLDKMPQLKDEKAQKELLSFLRKEGLQDNEISGLYDARYLIIAEKARKYDAMTKSGTKPRQKPNTPNVTKKKSTQPATPKQSNVEAQRLKLKQTGNMRDAAALFKNFV